jgi:hypothetical protein
MGRFERRLRFFRSLIRLAITDGREKLVSLRETRGDRRGIAGGLSVCFRSKPLIVVRPKTSSSKLEARLHIA